MKYIIAAFIGSTIGYVTNWLAIKMLFRPHNEIRIFGKRLPFTPGLIPKERLRISSSVGATVGEHLLTKETLVEALANEKMNKHIKKWISEKIKSVKNNSNSLRELLIKALGNKYDTVLEKIKLKSIKKLRELTVSDENKSKVEELLREFFKKVCKIPMEDIRNNSYFLQTRDFTIDKIKMLRDSKSFKTKLKGYIEDGIDNLESSGKTVRDVIPEEVIASLKVYIYSSRKDICDAVQQMLKQPSISERIKSAIAAMINTNLNSLLAAFVKVDTVYNKLITALEEYFKEDENQRNIVMLINDGIEKLSNEQITELFKKVSVEDRTVITEGLINLLSDKILTDALIDNIFNELEQSTTKYESLDELLSAINKDYVEHSLRFFVGKLEEFIKAGKFEKLADIVLSKLFEELLKTSPSELIGEEVDGIVNMATEAWENIFNRFLEKDALEVIEAMDIPKVVENRINSFDVAFAEKVMVSLAKRELNAITWLGALLGAVMGILSPILSKLY